MGAAAKRACDEATSGMLGKGERLSDVVDTHVGVPRGPEQRRCLADPGHQPTLQACSVVVALESGRHRGGIVKTPAEERAVEVHGCPGIRLESIDPARHADRLGITGCH
ncbi:hypothetical protein D9M72_472640 [compost metagenome]